jgi:hypothetical protein
MSLPALDPVREREVRSDKTATTAFVVGLLVVLGAVAYGLLRTLA